MRTHRNNNTKIPEQTKPISLTTIAFPGLFGIDLLEYPFRIYRIMVIHEC